ncbi:RNA-guided endonuclease InsQ/TnpB family protein [Prescottella agglutinans]|uniref:IS605 OrfB family transposase n=1 Tax=Prescottella agglutinans TaxID=1644129 RepID=A0ABT6ML43_9NOCA|nr:transposase [Prescottella agglutinans]MDH6285041.1 IS605 OrfB family transposase [Prescottella agglutinans]
MKRIVVVKLVPTAEQAAALKATLVACNQAADRVSDVAQASSDRRAFALHKSVYAQLKDSGLSAQPAVRVIKKVADAYATRASNLKAGNYGRVGSKRYAAVAESPIRFRLLAAQPFDDRCLSWRVDSSTVSIWTTAGRLKDVRFACAPWQRTLLADRRGESDLVFRDGAFYLYATVDQPAPEPVVPAKDPVGWVGVDLGVVNLAVTTDDDPNDLDDRWSGGAVTRRRKKNLALRTVLQRVGTKSAKRKLKTRRRKEQRFATDINHQLSKKIVAQAQRTGRGIAIEDLSGVRERVRLARKQRAQVHSWAYAQLRTHIEYKAEMAGVPVQVVDPRNTSRTCSQCGHCEQGNRRTQSVFRCRECGWAAHADLNAARNIAVLGHTNYWAAQSTVPIAATALAAS